MILPLEDFAVTCIELRRPIDKFSYTTVISLFEASDSLELVFSVDSSIFSVFVFLYSLRFCCTLSCDIGLQANIIHISHRTLPCNILLNPLASHWCETTPMITL